MTEENQLDELKKKLYRLHFLLTEKENEGTIKESLHQFEDCFKDTMSELSSFIANEYKQDNSNYFDIVDSAFEHKLFNREMTDDLKIMVSETDQLINDENPAGIYSRIRESYAGYLQMIHDMLSRMGQDAEEDE